MKKIYLLGKHSDKFVLKVCQKWEAYIKLPDKKIHLGTFVRLEDAVRVRAEASLKIYGEFST